MNATSHTTLLLTVLFVMGASPTLRAAPFGFSIDVPTTPLCAGDSFEAVCLLDVSNVPPDPSVFGWNIGVAVSGPCSIVDATLVGTDAETLTSFFVSAEPTPDGSGAVSVVGLSFASTLDSSASPYSVLALTLQSNGPGVCDLSFVDGLQGSGIPVPNSVVDSTPAEIVPDLIGAQVVIDGPTLSASSNEIDFGEVDVGNFETLSIPITNTSTDCTLDISSIDLAPGSSPDFVFSPTPAGLLLFPGLTASVQVIYTPSGPGTDAGILRIKSSDTNAPIVDIGLLGTGSAVSFSDCNGNGIPDDEDIEFGPSLDCNSNGIPDECESGPLGVPVSCETRFIRGDVDVSAVVDFSDALNHLGYLFLGLHEILCFDATDANDDGNSDLTDVIHLLRFLFLGTGVIPAPGLVECGPDPTFDNLSCESYPPCE